MNEHPILFSTPMVQALIAGRKTQTRRVIKQIPTSVDRQYAFSKDGKHYWKSGVNGVTEFGFRCPNGQPGDLIWVRESWSPKYVNGCLDEFRMVYPNNYPWIYKADHPDQKQGNAGHPWKPSIHMPKVAARIWLQIINIRVERLHDISPGDACDEGIEYDNVDADAFEGGELVADFTNYMWRDDETYEDYHFPTYASCVESFLSLWEKINGKESIDANPWVWVIEFKVVSTTGKPTDVDLLLDDLSTCEKCGHPFHMHEEDPTAPCPIY